MMVNDHFEKSFLVFLLQRTNGFFNYQSYSWIKKLKNLLINFKLLLEPRRVYLRLIMLLIYFDLGRLVYNF